MGEVCTLVLFITVGVHPDLLYIECLYTTNFFHPMYVHVDIYNNSIKKKEKLSNGKYRRGRLVLHWVDTRTDPNY